MSKQKTVSPDTIDVPCRFVGAVADSTSVKVRVFIEAQHLPVGRAVRYVLGAKLSATLIIDSEAQSDSPGQGRLIDTDQARVEIEARVKNITLKHKPVGYAFTMEMDAKKKQRDELLKFDAKSGRIIAERVGDVDEDAEANADDADEETPEVPFEDDAEGKGGPLGKVGT